MNAEEQFDAAIESADFDAARLVLRDSPEILASGTLYLNQAVCSATADGRTDILAFLRELGVDLNSFRKRIPFDGLLYLAAGRGQTKTVRWLIANGCEVMPEYEGQRHGQALVAACLEGHLDTAKVLIEAGSEVNSTYLDKNALLFALARDHTDLVDYLRSVGAKTPAELGLERPPQSKTQRGDKKPGTKKKPKS